MDIATNTKELNLKVVSALDRIKNNNVKGGYTGECLKRCNGKF